MLFRKSPVKKLSATRNELAAAEVKVDEIAKAETDAIETTDSHAVWRRDRDAAVLEVDRLRQLVAKLELEVAEEERTAAVAAQGKLEDSANQAADRAADVVKRNMATITQLAHEALLAIATADEQIAKANRGRPDDQARLLSTEQRVHAGAAAERDVISDRTIDVWCFSSTGIALDDEQVAKVKNVGSGAVLITEVPGPDLNVTEVRHHSVEKRKFRRLEYVPAQRVRFEPLAIAMNIPGIWSPLRAPATPSDIIARLEHHAERQTSSPRAEPVVELLPLRAEASAAA